MKNKLIKAGVLAALATCITLTSCQKEDMRILKNDSAEEPASQKTMFDGRCAAEIRLADTWTAGMASINLDVRRVALHYINGKIGIDGWVYMPVRAQVLDILQYQDGKSAFLAEDFHLPEGVLDQARVEFGDNNTAVWIDADGKHTTKLTLNESEHIATAPLNVRTNKTTKLGLVLDINAVQSIIILAGGTTVRFHPHMKLARMTREGMNGAPAEITIRDTK